MRALVYPSQINGTITAAPSKSYMQRICALALLNNGSVIINNPGDSNDDLAALKIIEDCGAVVERKENALIVTSNGEVNPPAQINVGESGLSVRMFAPILALSGQKVQINGSGSLLSRPVKSLIEALQALEVSVTSSEYKLPIILNNKLNINNIEIDGSLSSQHLTGLLFAFAYGTKTDVVVRVNHLVSKGYIDISMDLLNRFGYKIKQHNYELFSICPVVSPVQHLKMHVEGDWSGAAFLIVASVISGRLCIKGLTQDSLQSDKKILDVLEATGCKTRWENNLLMIEKPDKLFPFEIDAKDCPDLFPPLVALAVFCNGLSRIKGVHRLKYKESDRSKALMEEFAKLGVVVETNEDVMYIHGEGVIQSAKTFSHNDHRVAMALAIAALGADGVVEIDGAEAVHKSYPRFFEDLISAGACITLNKD